MELGKARNMKRKRMVNRKGLVFGLVLALVAVLFVGVPMNVSAEETTGDTILVKDINPGSSDSNLYPLAAVGDTVFFKAAQGTFDAVVCMYHDQGLIPFKLLHFEDGVNVTLGLPIVRTSVDHGTAYDIAGKGVADPASLEAAANLAHFIYVNRSRHGAADKTG